MSTDALESSSPAKLARVREMFAVPEAYVIAVAIWAGWTPVALLVMAPETASRGGFVALLGVLALAIPMLLAAVSLLRRRRSARTLMAYSTVASGAVIAAIGGAPALLVIYAHQLALVGLLWLPRIDAVLGDRYREQVMAMVPLVGRQRRALLAAGFLVAMLATGVLAVLPMG